MNQLFLSIALFCSVLTFGQKPETVYSIALEVREVSWYEQQLNLWKAGTDKNSHNGIAWTNYYMAARALRNLSYDNPDALKKWQQKCADIVKELHKSYPNSFEDYYLSYVNPGTFGNDELLLKAVAINPYDDRILDEMLIRNKIQFNEEGFRTYATKMFERNYLPAAILNWGHNLLSELDENAIVLTFGDNDTYAAWINQGALGFRTDVTVINTSLILVDDYREKLFRQLGMQPFTKKQDESTDYNVFTQMILQHIFDGNRPVYVVNSGLNQLPEALKSNLYVTGLSDKYSKTPLETGDLIVRNYENRYLIDYLNAAFSWHFADPKSREFNSMYLPSMIRLYWHYQQTEQTQQQEKTRQLLLKIAEASGQQSEVLELLKPENKNKALPQ